MSLSPLIVSDEPSKEDLLGRDVYARTLQKVAQNCQTPMVIGIHGDWGSGKTSLMRITQDLLEEHGINTVWFNPWVYQFDESPIIPLLHEIKNQTVLYRTKVKGLKLLSLLTSAAGEVILRISTGGAINSEFFLKQGAAFKKKYFEAKTVTMNIHKHFQQIVNAIVGKNGRLVIFIDDLDRCCPPQSLKVLEAIKLFLNAEKCVYIIGMDREAIEQAVVSQYGEQKLSGVSYLDKIIQLPFKIPPITDEGVNKYLDQLKQDTEIEPYYGIIRKGTANNPRAIKRFINTFSFNHALAQEIKIPQYKPHILIKLLILQLSFPDFYKYVSHHKKGFAQIEKWAENFESLDIQERKSIPEDVCNFLNQPDLIAIIIEQPLINEDDITPYVHLTNIFLPGASSAVSSIVCPKCGSPIKHTFHVLEPGDTTTGYNPEYVDVYNCTNPKCGYVDKV
jgi:predicted KAP-like P-loop ATPase